MKDLSSDNQADVFKAFNSTSRYLDDLLNKENLTSYLDKWQWCTLPSVRIFLRSQYL